MALLNQRWALHDVADVDALLTAAVSRSRCAAHLQPDERDELIAWLFELAWKLSEKFDPNRGSFSTFLYGCTSRGIADWHRSRYRTRWITRGRVYERRRPELVSLDDSDDPDRLGRVVGEGTGTRTIDWDPALTRIQRTGRRQRHEDLETLRRRPPR